MHVLITNDDGYSAPGLIALAEAIRELGWRGTIVAPSNHMSGASRSRLSGVPLRWQHGRRISSFPVFHIDGTPAACVVFGLTSGLFEPFDLCISGINAGENLGAGLTVSGTFGAALEATTYDVRSIAISRQRETLNTKPELWDWSWVSKATCTTLAQLIGHHGDWNLANINLPNRVSNTDPIYTKISSASYFYDCFDLSQGYILSTIGYRPDKVDPDDDISVFAELGRISITLLSGKIV